MKKTAFTLFFFLIAVVVFSQVKPKKPIQLDDLPISNSPANTDVQQQANAQPTGPRKDTIGFEHRDDSKDAVTLSYKFLDSTKRNRLDSTVDDFDKYFSVPSTFLYLGNNGAAATSLIFQPNDIIGFDPGFHAFDIYKYKLEGTKFYKTNKPYSMLSYQLASGKEQMLKAGHTQNPKPNLNVGFDYKLISAPGFFVTQNTNHNSYRIFGSYQGMHKRYNALISIVGNNIRASENGGIQNDSLLSDPNRKDRFTVPVNFGSNAAFRNNPFVTTVLTGNHYKDFNFFLRQSYDLGKRDSIAINDSTTEYLFYPKLRLQYTFTGIGNTYRFSDVAADSTLYSNWYGLTLRKDNDSFAIQEKWKIIKNDFSLLQFPDTKNAAEFFLAGVTLQNITGELRDGKTNFYNLYLHGEYRNRTRNKLWDMLAKGEFYINGLNAGDYNAHATLNRYINKKLGNVSMYFSNSNRTASFIFDERSVFNLGNVNNLKKENITSFGAQTTNSFITLSFKNHLIANFTYFKNYYQSEQYSPLINIIQFSASKKIRLNKNWYWYLDATLQQIDAAAPINLPLFFSRNRLAYEGRVFKNLNLSTGIEARYYTAYKADNYSPILGQFTKQDSITIKNLPDISLYLNFRIKGFTGFLRAENLNTASINNGFGFINNNFAAPLYPTQGLMIRFGIQWWFVN